MQMIELKQRASSKEKQMNALSISSRNKKGGAEDLQRRHKGNGIRFG